jgi:hypothetical protein
VTLVKRAPKKSFAQKTDFSGLRKNSFLAKTFLKKKWERKADFLIPHWTYSKKKCIYLLEGTMNLFGILKGQKWKKLLKVRKPV